MKNLFIFIITGVVATLFFACNRENLGAYQSPLVGDWESHLSLDDTLQIVKENGDIVNVTILPVDVYLNFKEDLTYTLEEKVDTSYFSSLDSIPKSMEAYLPVGADTYVKDGKISFVRSGIWEETTPKYYELFYQTEDNSKIPAGVKVSLTNKDIIVLEFGKGVFIKGRRQ